MADNTVFLLLFLLTAFYTATAQQRYTNITTGSSLTPTGNSSSWQSPSGLYAFGFYRQGSGYSVGIFISGIPDKTVVWTANRDDPLVNQTTTLALTADGRLVLRRTQGQETNIATNSQSASSASMLDTGNFVLYSSDGDIIWQSFEYPTDTLLVGQRILNGGSLISSISETDHSMGISYLAMQSDGNLVQYPFEGPRSPQNAYWASGTYGAGNNVTLNLNDDGYLYLFNSSTIIRNLTNGGYPKGRIIYLMRNDVDGIFRLYSYNLNQQANWSILWSSSDDKCVAKGLCGPNGYCVLDDTEAKCSCLPGFDFVDPARWIAGCTRNSAAQSCRNNDKSVQYSMMELPNTVWDDAFYSTLKDTTKEDCKSACVKDCNCEAALFKDGQCKMQRLPLRFGRRKLDDTNMALVKMESAPNVVPDPPHMHKESKKELTVPILITCVSLAAFGFIFLAISGIIIYRNRVWTYKMISEKGNGELGDDFGPRAFTYAELEAVTNGFTYEVGSGSFGTVYKGAMQNTEMVVAVKRLEKGLVEGEREFQTEMKVIGKTHHRNLVKLLGYCLEGPKRLLVYEYMSNGSLADILFKHENQPCWEERIGIAKDIARGILYLHEECEMQIIHCDIKPQNILMDEYRCAKVSDFGIAKLMTPEQTKTFTAIRGTRGYVAPEWHRKLPVTVKADVYSFGIVLLEIISCRRSLDMSLGEEEAILEEWIYQCFEGGELGKIVGEEVVDKRKIDRMVKVGLWCIQDEPSIRPSMKKVLLMLEGTVDIPIPPSPTSFLSAI
ncbi:hypothetical protein LguiA_013458 [Lonicera macranthoides]